jgi:hypothetical protein
LPDEVSSIWNDRATIFSGPITTMDELVGLYLGQVPTSFMEFFHEEMTVHHINMIRLAWDDLASMAGKVFPVYVRSDNDTATARDRAEHLEKWAYGINDAGQNVGAIGGELLMKVLSWWMAGVGEAIPMVLPSYERRTPYFTFRDPRHYYPPVGWSPYTQAAADDALFAYQLTIGELKRRYPARREELDRVLSRSASSASMPITAVRDSSPVWVGEYYHVDAWIVQTLTERSVMLARSDTGDRGHPDIVPVVPMSLYSPGVRARPIFADQVSIQAAMARMFSQKLDYYDRTLYPVIFTTPLADKTVRVGPWAINEWDPTFQGQFRVDTIEPKNAIDADQTMAFVMGLSRILNRNPETFQGQAPSGRADSAKAIESLKSAVADTTVRDMLWPPMIAAMPRLYSKAAELELKLWPNERKAISGRRKNTRFATTIRPKTELEGREESFEVEQGSGLGGYRGTLEILQLVQAELKSEEDALEEMEGVRDAGEAQRKIQTNRAQKVIWQNLATRALAPPGTPGGLKAGAMSKLVQKVQEGADIFVALRQLEEADEMYEPMAPPPEPGLAGAAGPPTGMVAPPLELLRGGRA